MNEDKINQKDIQGKPDGIELFIEKKDCCACGACLNSCSKHAIYMKEDEFGFIYPVIDQDKCVACGLCNKSCAFQNIKETNLPIEVYAAVNKDEVSLKKSASGGIFAAMATQVLQGHGVVFGCTFNSDLMPEHIGITNVSELIRLQGSKYSQSTMGTTYQEAQTYLNSGREVLFSGTPCQIAGLKSFLKKDYKNLILLDIICHGVPSARIFKDYLLFAEKKLKGEIVNFNFRDKTTGWGLQGKVYYSLKRKIRRNVRNEVKEKLIHPKLSSYYQYFLNSCIYRESCYHCKYACENRPGDFTIGDFWGIQEEHPECLKKNGNDCADHKLDVNKGVSVLIVNTEKGGMLLKEYRDLLTLIPSTFEKAARKNEQLNQPCKINRDRDKIMEIYRSQGYLAIDEIYYQSIGSDQLKYVLKSMVPPKIKVKLKNSFSGLK